ncbi:MAG TPA: hypothetical protein VGR80_06795, partial [Steroidobacteraceae bacterium]|nr:hypothetical protein [Steroidobacteraceae bacterium]
EFLTVRAARAYLEGSLGIRAASPRRLGAIAHAFTHFDLLIRPLLVSCGGATSAVTAVEEGTTLWYNVRAPARIGLPAPIAALLAPLASGRVPDDSRPAEQPGG